MGYADGPDFGYPEGTKVMYYMYGEGTENHLEGSSSEQEVPCSRKTNPLERRSQ